MALNNAGSPSAYNKAMAICTRMASLEWSADNVCGTVLEVIRRCGAPGLDFVLFHSSRAVAELRQVSEANNKWLHKFMLAILRDDAYMEMFTKLVHVYRLTAFRFTSKYFENGVCRDAMVNAIVMDDNGPTLIKRAWACLPGKANRASQRAPITTGERSWKFLQCILRCYERWLAFEDYSEEGSLLWLEAVEACLSFKAGPIEHTVHATELMRDTKILSMALAPPSKASIFTCKSICTRLDLKWEWCCSLYCVIGRAVDQCSMTPWTAEMVDWLSSQNTDFAEHMAHGKCPRLDTLVQWFSPRKNARHYRVVENDPEQCRELFKQDAKNELLLKHGSFTETMFIIVRMVYRLVEKETFDVPMLHVRELHTFTTSLFFATVYYAPSDISPGTLLTTFFTMLSRCIMNSWNASRTLLDIITEDEQWPFPPFRFFCPFISVKQTGIAKQALTVAEHAFKQAFLGRSIYVVVAAYIQRLDTKIAKSVVDTCLNTPKMRHGIGAGSNIDMLAPHTPDRHGFIPMRQTTCPGLDSSVHSFMKNRLFLPPAIMNYRHKGFWNTLLTDQSRDIVLTFLACIGRRQSQRVHCLPIELQHYVISLCLSSYPLVTLTAEQVP